MNKYSLYFLLSLVLLSCLLSFVYDGCTGYVVAIAPLVVAGLIGAGASLASTAYTNYRNVQESDSLNQYNTPLSQRRRLEQAGINPALAMTAGQLGTGNATSIPPREQYQLNVPEMMQAEQNQEMIDSQKVLNDENARYMRLRGDTHQAEVLASIASAYEQIQSSKMERSVKEKMLRQLDYEYKYHLETESDRKAMLKNQSESLAEDVLTKRFERDLSSQRFVLEKRINAAQVNQLSALAANLSVQASEMVRNGKSQREVNDWLNREVFQRLKGIKLDNEQKKQLLPWIVAGAKKNYASVKAGALGEFSIPSYVFEEK